ncbi:hypothetical protein [Sphingomonas faeni]|uniref:hypothetical protein n=1 Tax=Sphingomonas faeni TaxID=185950 RepID=UPI00334ACB16
MTAPSTKATIDTPSDTAEPVGLKTWSTPQVIVSELRNAGAQVGVGSDGTSPISNYQYGS